MDPATLAARLEEARRGLLDLSTRNRLLALPAPGRSRGVVILDDEDADFVLAELTAGRAFAFEAAAPEEEAPPPPPPQGAPADAAGPGIANDDPDGEDDAPEGTETPAAGAEASGEASGTTRRRRRRAAAPEATVAPAAVPTPPAPANANAPTSTGKAARGSRSRSAKAAPAAAPAATGSARRTTRRRTPARVEGIATADAGQSREEARSDNRLRVRLPAADLARRLRDLMQDARTAREETGIATLSLALGTLSWRDPGTPETVRLAPLALLPVTLEREGVSQTFRLRAAGLEVQENLSLRQKLATEFRVELPAFDPEAYDPTAWAEALRAAIGSREGWEVDPDGLAVGLFSFQKFLMWRDLDPAANPGLLTHPMVRALVGGVMVSGAAPFPDDAEVDAEIPVERLDHVMDVDGSQALAAEAVRRGGTAPGGGEAGALAGHVVIQGPPGTGKSQTIANIIAQAILDGRKVLFVAEKLAALEVVERRLGAIGLAPATLELHSEKQSKRAVLDELRATLALPPPPRPQREALVKRLGALRARLNGHARAMAAPVGDSGRPLFAVVGALVALRAGGTAAPDFELDCGGWDAARLAAARDAVEELAARAAEADPGRHPWRGVTAELAPIAQERLMARLPEQIRALAAGAAALAPAAAALGRPAPGRAGAAALLALSRAVAVAPAHDRAAMAHPAWAQEAETLRALAQAATTLAAAATDPRLLPGATKVQGLEEARATLAQGSGLFSFLSAAQRAAKAVAAQVAAPGADPVAALDAAIAAQAAERTLAAGEASGRAAFGPLWGDAAAMTALATWRGRHGAEAAEALAKGMPPFDAGVVEAAIAAQDAVVQTTALDIQVAFGTEHPPLAAVAERLGDWVAQPEALTAWMAWGRARQACGPELAPIADRLADGRLPPEAAVAAFDYARDEALLQAAMRARPELATFDGAGFDRLVEEFREADRARIELARKEAAAAHARSIAEVRGMPAYTLLLGEFEKKRGHLPVRELLNRAGQAVQAAKPVFMMSPLSVAQFLAPPHGLRPGLTFDLLVIDEASQVEPVDALGAIARCRQVVVVGDDKQMPPTRFFQRMTSEDGEEIDEQADAPVAAREVESILGLANARGVPNVMLRWHYRSRHESLIATSNAEFYGSRLLVLPSPRARSAVLGLSLVRVDGQWEAGKGVNRKEAEAVAEAVLRHARETPGDTLGVAAFSLKQRDAILDAIEALRRDSPDTEAFFTAYEHEPFFVKNLENVQGDERDAILISVGYARDRDGKVAMRFGPLSSDGGERRLNVLITRAKKRCVVFSGIGADDIDLERASGRGVAALKTFLQFAASGGEGRARGEQVETPLATVIAQEMRAAGLEPVARVGTSGLFLDVAARREQDFVLGVEADGGDWASVRAARDRERGRATALGQMGWALHRAWSLAWLQRPEAERARLRSALGLEPAAEAPTSAPVGPDPGLAAPYAEAAPEVPKETPIPGVPFGQLATLLAEVIRAEQPVHTDAVLERLRLLWGQERLAPADRAALQQGLRLATQLEGVAEAGGFWTAEGAPPVTPRDRRACAPHLRRAALLPPAEIEAAARTLLAALPRSTEPELVAGVVRMLGLEAAAQPAIAARIAALVGAGAIRPAG